MYSGRRKKSAGVDAENHDHGGMMLLEDRSDPSDNQIGSNHFRKIEMASRPGKHGQSSSLGLLNVFKLQQSQPNKIRQQQQFVSTNE